MGDAPGTLLHGHVAGLQAAVREGPTQHGLFCLVKRCLCMRVQTAAVLQPLPQAAQEVICGDLQSGGTMI